MFMSIYSSTSCLLHSSPPGQCPRSWRAIIVGNDPSPNATELTRAIHWLSTCMGYMTTTTIPRRSSAATPVTDVHVTTLTSVASAWHGWPADVTLGRQNIGKTPTIDVQLGARRLAEQTGVSGTTWKWKMKGEYLQCYAKPDCPAPPSVTHVAEGVRNLRTMF